MEMSEEKKLSLGDLTTPESLGCLLNLLQSDDVMFSIIELFNKSFEFPAQLRWAEHALTALLADRTLSYREIVAATIILWTRHANKLSKYSSEWLPSLYGAALQQLECSNQHLPRLLLRLRDPVFTQQCLGKSAEHLLFEQNSWVNCAAEDLLSAFPLPPSTRPAVPATELTEYQLQNTQPWTYEEICRECESLRYIFSIHNDNFGFMPNFVSIVPVISDVDEDEWRWMDSECSELQQDTTIKQAWVPLGSMISLSDRDADELIAKAETSPLLSRQLEVLIHALKTDRRIASRVTATKVAGLLKFNWSILVATIVSLFNVHKGALDILDVLTAMEPSSAVLSVVHSVAQQVALPSSFLATFCTVYIKAAPRSPTVVKPFLVRQFVEFLQHTLNSQPAEMAPLLPELQSFCLGYTNMESVATFYRHVKLLLAN